MIKVNDRFSFERDQYCWHLHEFRDGTDKKGNPKKSKKTSYYANLSQISKAIIDRTAGGFNSLEEIKELLATAESILVKELEKE